MMVAGNGVPGAPGPLAEIRRLRKQVEELKTELAAAVSRGQLATAERDRMRQELQAVRKEGAEELRAERDAAVARAEKAESDAKVLAKALGAATDDLTALKAKLGGKRR